MALFAACDLNTPHLIRAFLNNDGVAPLPPQYLCVPADQASVDNGTLILGMEWNGSAFVVYVPPTPEGPFFYVQPSDLSTTSATLIDVPNFALQLFPGKRYLIDCHLWWRSAATTTGVLFSVTGPTSPVGVDVTVETALTTSTMNVQRITAYDGGVPTGSIDTANADRLCRMTGFIQTDINGGLLKLRARSEVSGSAVTLRTGSRAEITVI
jgi:hypothetical protein